MGERVRVVRIKGTPSSARAAVVFLTQHARISRALLYFPVLDTQNVGDPAMTDGDYRG